MDSATLVVSIAVPFITFCGTVIPVLANLKLARKDIKEQVNLIIRDIARLTMHDEHLPIEERLTAGDRYLASGGNGPSKVYYDELVQQYQKKLKMKKPRAAEEENV
jgi:hypothetical protein